MSPHPDQSSAGDLVRIWRPQALTLAAKSRSPDPVGHFLESKGIPQRLASESAIAIWHEAQRDRRRARLPRLVIGWFLIILGLGLTTITLLWHGRFVVISLGPVALGAAVVWGGYLSGGPD